MNQKLRTKFIDAAILMDEALSLSPVPPLPPSNHKFPLNLANANQVELEAALDAAITDLRIFHHFGAK